MSPLTYVFRNGKPQVGPPGKDKVCWGTGRKKGCMASGSGPPPPLGSTKREGRFYRSTIQGSAKRPQGTRIRMGEGVCVVGPGRVGWEQQLAQGFILVDVGTSEQILDEPRGMSWGHGGDQRCFSAWAKLWKTSCPNIRQKGWDMVLRATTSLGLEGPSGSGTG